MVISATVINKNYTFPNFKKINKIKRLHDMKMFSKLDIESCYLMLTQHL